MLIRPERPDDVDAIDRLTVAAFEPQWFSDGSEAPIIRSLRASGDLTLSLVAEDDGDVIGHVAFSPVTIDGVARRLVRARADLRPARPATAGYRSGTRG